MTGLFGSPVLSPEGGKFPLIVSILIFLKLEKFRPEEYI